MNIGYIVSVPEIGGAERMLEILLRGLRGSDFTPYFVCPSQGLMADLVQSLGIPVEFNELYQPSWRNPIQTYLHWRKWSAFITSNKLSLIHANDLSGGRSSIFAAYTRNIPLLCHVHSFYSEEYCRWVFQRLPKPIGFIFCSQDLREQVGQFLERACPTSRQWVVHNGIDIHTFTPFQPMNAIPRIGVVANLKAKKGHEDFLEMAALLTKERKEARYDIIGGDFLQQPRQEKLEVYAKKLGIEERVYFHGQVDQVADLVKQLDVLVCPSHIEGLPLCIIEAMACGKPVVATNINGIPEAIEDAKSGFLVPPHAPKELAKAVSTLLDDQNMRKIMGENGRKRVEQFFSRETYIAAILKVYHEVLKI